MSGGDIFSLQQISGLRKAKGKPPVQALNLTGGFFSILA